MTAKAIALSVGHVVGRLTVTGLPERKGKYLYAPVRCECGVEKLVEQTNLRKGKVNSCGCLNKELIAARSKTHGMRANPLYAVWNAMLQRVTNPNDAGYANYGGRGITVCDSWRTFEGFYADMGDRPFEGAMLDRKDNDVGYSKANCQWVTRAEQNNNTRKNVLFDYKGEKLSLADIANKSDIKLATIRNRIYRYGMNAEEAATMPAIAPEQSGAMAGSPLLTPTNKRLDGELLYTKEENNE